MKPPRDLSGSDLVRHLGQFGGAVARQTGSHVRLTSSASKAHGEHPPHHPESRSAANRHLQQFTIAWPRITA